MAKKDKKEKKKFSILKLIRNLVITCVVLLVSIYLIVIFALGPILTPILSEVISPILGASLTIDEVHVSPLLNGITVKGITMGSPEGFKAESAFELKHFNASIDLASLLTKVIIINEIVIDGASITYEHNMKTFSKSNFTRINRNVQFFVGAVDENGDPIISEDDPEIEEDAVESETEVLAEQPATIEKIIIKKFRFINGHIRVSNTLYSGMTIPSPMMDIKMDDVVIKIEKRMTMGQAIYKAGEKIFSGGSDIIGSLHLDKISGKIADGTMKTVGLIGDGASKTGTMVYDGAKGALNAVGTGVSTTGSTIIESAKGVTEGVGSLFNVFGKSEKKKEEK